MDKIAKTVVLLTGLTSLVACGSTERNATKAEEVDSTTVTPGNAPDVLERYGRSYIRRDLWTDEEYQRILDDAKPTDAPVTAANVAARLRSHVRVGGVYYIEAEPNLELGEAVLRGEFENTPPGVPREARTVIVTDSRTNVGSPQSYPYRTIAFMNTGCTATKVGRYTMITAAHCLFVNDVNEWRCADGSPASGGGCASGWPAWRFGTQNSTGFGSFFGSDCGWQAVTSEYVALDGTLETFAKQWTAARYDFGFIDLTGCTEYTTGWLGTWIAGDTELSNMEGFAYGYPQWATCQDGVFAGDPNKCTGYRYNGDMTKPFSGAQIWGTSSTDVRKGPAGYEADTIQSDLDDTMGQSGSALWFNIAANDRRAVGVVSNNRFGLTGLNGFSRFTGAKYNWLAANSQYPEDTQ